MDIRKFSGKLILGMLFCLVLALLPGKNMTAYAADITGTTTA